MKAPWLEPIPDAMVDDPRADPATIVTSRERIRLALIAALQHRLVGFLGRKPC